MSLLGTSLVQTHTHALRIHTFDLLNSTSSRLSLIWKSAALNTRGCPRTSSVDTLRLTCAEQGAVQTGLRLVRGAALGCLLTTQWQVYSRLLHGYWRGIRLWVLLNWENHERITHLWPGPCHHYPYEIFEVVKEAGKKGRAAVSQTQGYRQPPFSFLPLSPLQRSHGDSDGKIQILIDLIN